MVAIHLIILVPSVLLRIGVIVVNYSLDRLAAMIASVQSNLLLSLPNIWFRIDYYFFNCMQPTVCTCLVKGERLLMTLICTAIVKSSK